MTQLSITPDIDRNPWPHLDGAPHGQLVAIGLMRHATSEGRAAVYLDIELSDGSHVSAATTWRNMQAAVRALAAGPVGSEEVLD